MNPYSSEHFNREAALIGLLDQGHTPEAIAKSLDLSIKEIEKYQYPHVERRRLHAKRRKIRQQFVDGISIRTLSDEHDVNEHSILSLCADLSHKRRIDFDEELPRADRSKQVMIRLNEPGVGERIIVAQPTGRMDHIHAHYDPERKWRFEAIDVSDGIPKFYAWDEVLTWSPR